VLFPPSGMSIVASLAAPGTGWWVAVGETDVAAFLVVLGTLLVAV